MTEELMDSNKNNWERTLEFYKNHLDMPLHIDEIPIDKIGHIYEARIRFRANINGQGMGLPYFNMFKDDNPLLLGRVNDALYKLLDQGHLDMDDFDDVMREFYPDYI